MSEAGYFGIKVHSWVLRTRQVLALIEKAKNMKLQISIPVNLKVYSSNSFKSKDNHSSLIFLTLLQSV